VHSTSERFSCVNSLKSEVYIGLNNIYKFSSYVKNIYCISITKTTGLMLLATWSQFIMEIIRNKHICGKGAKYFNVIGSATCNNHCALKG
jgi:hypothetical protein